jgi:hypothetical protein
MINFKNIINRTQSIKAEIKTIRQCENVTLADCKRLALLRTELLQISPAERFIWVGGNPVIDLFYELSRPLA